MTHPSHNRWVAGLPLYDFPTLRSAHDTWWTAIAASLRRFGVQDVPSRLGSGLPVTTLLRHPRLLLAQACEYPLALSPGEHLQIVAAPHYTAEGCDGDRYRSAVIVRREDPADSISDLRGRRCVVNERDSNSGMNLLRAVVAPIAAGAPFFGSVRLSGAHLRSLEFVANGAADVAAIDCISLALMRAWQPSLTQQIRVLAWTPSSPTPPYVTARNTGAATVDALRSALFEVATDPALVAVRSALLLSDVSARVDSGYSEVLALASNSIRQGFPVIA